MKQDIEELLESVDIMRGIVRQVRAAALGDGFSFIAVGLIYGVASLATAVVKMTAPDSAYDGSHTMLWATGLLGIVLVGRNLTVDKGREDESSIARIVRFARYGFIGALGTMLIAAWIVNRTFANIAGQLLPVIVFALFGGLWTAMSGLNDAFWPRLVAFGCFTAALLLAVMGQQHHHQLLAFGIAMLVLIFLPGVVIWRTAHRL